jgi:hypothetical protein
MGSLKIRFRFNPGGAGAPMDRLGVFAAQTEKFLRSLSSDLGLEARGGLWLAKNFKNESVGFDAEFAGAVPDVAAARGNVALTKIFGDDPLDAIGDSVSYGTLAQFSRIGDALEPQEYFTASIYAPDDREARTEYRITYKQTAEIRALLAAPIVSHGTLQGVLHAWHPGSEPPFFTIRLLQNGELVRCEYDPAFYHDVHQATKQEHAALLVTGRIEWDKATNGIVRVDVSTPPLTAAPLSESEFERLFGSIPQFTGTMTTDEYIDWVRGDGD